MRVRSGSRDGRLVIVEVAGSQPEAGAALLGRADLEAAAAACTPRPEAVARRARITGKRPRLLRSGCQVGLGLDADLKRRALEGAGRELLPPALNTRARSRTGSPRQRRVERGTTGAAQQRLRPHP